MTARVLGKENWFVIILTGIVVLTMAVLWYYSNNPLTTRALINGHTIFLELAVTPEEKGRGLGYRKSMPRDHGMLFLNDHKETYNYWMKGMEFPLDFVWIGDTTVMDITENVQPPDVEPLRAIEPIVPVDKILELNAGMAKELGIEIGDTVEFLP